MSCKYCRGEKALLNNEGYDGGWYVVTSPRDGTLQAYFSAGPLYGNACGSLELDIEYCPMCGTPMIYAMEEALNG